MEENKTPNKVLPILGIILSLIFLGLGGAVSWEMLFGGYNIAWSALFYSLVFVLLGLFLLIKSISALLRKKPKEPKPFSIKKLMLILFVIGVFALIVGCLEGTALLVVLGAILVVFMLAISISMARDAAIAKKHGDGAQEVFEKKKHRGTLVVALLLIAALCAAGFLLSKFTPAEEDKRGYCEVCETEYTNREDVRSIAKTNMCEDCYELFQIFEQYADE